MGNNELVRAYQNGDKDAMEKLILQNKGMVTKIARKYAAGGKYEIEDLIQDGYIGLMKAAEKFDFSKEVKFMTYAIWWIEQSICRSVLITGRTIKIPVQTLTELNKINRAVSKLTPELGEKIDLEIISEHTGMDIEKVEELLSYNVNTISLDCPIGDEEVSTLIDTIPSQVSTPEEAIEDKDFRRFIRSLIDECLDEANKDIIEARYGFNGNPETVVGISQRYGVSPVAIDQKIKKSLHKLRRTPELIKYEQENYVDELTDFYMGGKQAVESKVIHREWLRKGITERTEPFFYFWYKQLKKNKYAIDNELKGFSPGEIQEVNLKLECVQRALIDMSISDKSFGWFIVEKRIEGYSEEDVKRIYSGSDYHNEEKSAIKSIITVLKNNNLYDV